MVAIEFQAQIKNGVIEIPEAYRKHLAESVRVIILTPERPEPTGMIARLIATPINDPDFVPLTRDEIYGDRTTLYSEDMHDSLRVEEQLTIINPFI